MKDFTIRKGTYEDLYAIVLLQKQWMKEEITYGFTAADIKYLETKLGSYFLVAVKEKEIVGFAYGTVHKAEKMAVFDEGELYIEIDDIYTSANSREKGIGSCLLSELLKIAKENGIERSLVYSSTKETDDIMKFYKKHGFKTWYIQMFR